MIRQILFVILSFSLYSISCQNLRITLSCDQKRTFIDGHNQRRFVVAQGLAAKQPPASNMKLMVWDEELAEKAARWAQHGVFDHNPDRNIGSKRWDLIGENVYLSKYFSTEEVVVIPDIEAALDEWFNENQNYGFEPFKLGTEKPIGHYTQMVWADSTRVGCGISQKKDNWTETLFVCNYGPTGNYIGKLPYESNGAKGYLHCDWGVVCNRPYGLYC